MKNLLSLTSGDPVVKISIVIIIISVLIGFSAPLLVDFLPVDAVPAAPVGPSAVPSPPVAP